MLVCKRLTEVEIAQAPVVGREPHVVGVVVDSWAVSEQVLTSWTRIVPAKFSMILPQIQYPTEREPWHSRKRRKQTLYEATGRIDSLHRSEFGSVLRVEACLHDISP